ncbi:hypothetical protein TKK_0001329 [Trichogramma kaykai]
MNFVKDVSIGVNHVLMQKLEACCKVFEIKYKKPLSDSKTRWNSTFDMLYVAHAMKDALDQVVKKNSHLSHLFVKECEWELLEILIKFLGHFNRVSEMISGEKYITLPSAVIAFNCLLDMVEKKSFDLDTEDRSFTDEKLIIAFQNGRNKLLKHYKKFNWIYCVSLILDPRVKAIGLDSTPWGKEMAKQTVDKFEEIYKKYHNKFKAELVEEPAKKRRRISNEDDLDFNVLFVKPEKSFSSMAEVNLYLDSPRPDPDTDILLWWKLHEKEYPIIARMARDILCISATSVPAERLFSASSHVLTKTRCSLHDESIRELICINMWMRSGKRSEICEV